MAINIRFGSGGDLLSLAQRSGEGAAFDRRFAQGQQLVQQGLQQQAQRAAIQLEQQRLDLLAQQARTNVSRTPTSRARNVTPFTQSVQQDNAEFKQMIPLSLAGQAGSGGTGNIKASDGTSAFQVDEAGKFTGQELGIELTEEDVLKRGNFVSGTPEQGATPLAQAKLGFLQNVTNIDPANQQALMTLVNDPNIDLNEMAIRTNQLRSTPAKQELDLNQQLRIRERALRDEQADNDAELRAIEAQLREADIEPLGREPNELLRAAGGNRPVQAMIERRAILLEKNRQLRAQQQSLVGQEIQQLRQSQEPDNAAQASDQDILDALGL